MTGKHPRQEIQCLARWEQIVISNQEMCKASLRPRPKMRGRRDREGVGGGERD